MTWPKKLREDVKAMTEVGRRGLVGSLAELGAAVRDRVQKTGRTASGATGPTHSITGEMWESLSVRPRGTRKAVTYFRGSSYPSYGGSPKAQYYRKGAKKIRNRDKAWYAQRNAKNPNEAILDVSKSEMNSLMAGMLSHIRSTASSSVEYSGGTRMDSLARRIASTLR